MGSDNGLQQNNDEHNHHENVRLHDASEDVKLVFKFTGVEEINDLHAHE